MKRTTVAVATAIVSAASAFAQNTQMMDQMTQSNLHTESPWTVGLGVALPLGVGGEVNYRISPKFSVSVGAYAASFKRDFDGEERTVTRPGTGYSLDLVRQGAEIPTELLKYAEYGSEPNIAVVGNLYPDGREVLAFDNNPEMFPSGPNGEMSSALNFNLETLTKINELNGAMPPSTRQVQPKYDVNLKINGFPIVANYHPFEGAFHITAGIIINNTKATGKETGDDFEGLVYTAEFKNKVMPYLGIGSLGRFDQSNWGYFWEVGAMFTGGIKTSVTGGADLDQAIVDAERKDFEESLPKINVLPVVKLGLTYSF